MPECRLLLECVQAQPSCRTRGAFHMAVDEVLLQTASATGLSTLRFYVWSPATLSLGYFQRVADRALHPASRDCELVRRASGGGAILHDCELTYAFAVPASARLGSTEHLYTAVHESLVATLADHFQIQTSLCARRERTEDAFLCFQRRAVGDVLLERFKIAGSAQRRWKNAVLQHGSVLLGKSSFAPELPGLADLARCTIEPAVLAERWCPSIESRLNLSLRLGALTDLEEQRIVEVCESKFDQQAWTERR